MEEKEKFAEEAVLARGEGMLIDHGGAVGNLGLLLKGFPRWMDAGEFEKGKRLMRVREAHLSDGQKRELQDWFWTKDGFDRTKLALLGLLLCGDEEYLKICFWFSAGEHKQGNRLTRESFSSMTNQLLDLSLEVLPSTLCPQSSSEYPGLSCDLYLRRLQAAKEIAHRHCLRRIMANKSEIRMDTFVRAVLKEEIEISSKGLRHYTVKQCSGFWATQGNNLTEK